MVKRITAREVAEQAGVSRTTVSFVLNNVAGMRISEETRKRVIDAAKLLNYFPDATARRMVSGKTNTVGFVMRQRPNQAFADHFLPEVLQGLSQAAQRKGYHILVSLVPPNDEANQYWNIIHEHQVDGIVVSGPLIHDAELLKMHTQGSFVVVMGTIPGADIPSIDVDNIHGAELATKHLIQLGHRRIGIITNASLLYSASSDRLTGYRQALLSAGIPYDPDLLRCGNFTPESGFNALEELLALRNRPTAVFVASDTVALGAIQLIRQSDLRIPEDIAIVGFDDIPLAEFVEPALTTVHLPANGLGWGAADLVIRLINGGNSQRNTRVLLETQLVVRKSCGANPNWPEPLNK